MSPLTLLLLLVGATLVVARLYQLNRNASNQTRGSWAALTLVAFGLMFIGPSIASAAVPGDETPVGPDASTNSLFNLDPFVVSIIIGVLIPFLVALVTDASVSPAFKKLLTAVLAAVGGIITVGATDDGGALISAASLKSAALTIMLAATTYILFLRNSKTEARLNAAGPTIGPKTAA